MQRTGSMQKKLIESSDEYRAAGEFYRYLLTALGFGDLTMRHEERAFVYQWHFKIDDRHLSAEHSVTDIEFRQSRFLGDRAGAVAARWKREIKESQR